MWRWLQSPLIRSMLFSSATSGFIYNGFYATYLPSFFVEVYQAPIAELGYLTTAAPLANAAVCLGAGLFSDRLVSRHGWRTLEARRMMQGIGTLVPGLCMVGLAHARGAWEAAAVVTVWMAAHGFQAAGGHALLHDVAGHRASELFVVLNAAAKLTGVVAASAIRHIVAVWGWESLLYIVSLQYLLNGLFLVPLIRDTDAARKQFLGAGAGAGTADVKAA